MAETKTRPPKESKKKVETVTPEKKQAKSKKEKIAKQEKPPEKKRYKILAGNGCHRAIAEVQGMLVQSTEESGKFSLILTDGLQIQAFFKTPQLHWLACNTEAIQGLHWWRGYPKVSDNKLVCFQIIAWDGAMTDNKYEKWEFIGVWTAQRNITVQRTMSEKDIRKLAKETGFIKKFKYTFTNSYDFKRSLWVGYVYKILASRKGDSFEIRKVIPYACPRIKPKPPERKPRK